jgi:hypothetical protein
MTDELFRLDLAQVERVRRLQQRIEEGLKDYDEYTKCVAREEMVADSIKAGLCSGKADGSTPEVAIERLRDEQGRALAVLKAGVWNTSEGLRRDHQLRKEIAAREQELEA